MTALRTAYRGLCVALIILTYIITTAIVTLVIRSRRKRLLINGRILSVYARMALKALGIRARLHGPCAFRPGNMIVANHVSYLDILLLSGFFPGVFITSVEMRDSGLEGLLIRLTGTVIVERRDISHLRNEIAAIRELIHQGLTLFLFPEATSTNGEALKPFKSTLFASLEKSGQDILPLCVQYSQVNGEPINQTSRDLVFWYGDMTFIPHVRRLLTISGAEVDITCLTPISTQEYPGRKDMARETFARISAVYKPVPAETAAPGVDDPA